MCNANLKIIGALVAVLASSLAFADESCDGNQLQLEACATEKMDAADKRLNDAYSRYRNTIASQEDQKNLRAAQRIWMKFRDMDCSAVVSPGERRGIGYLEWAGCVTSRTISRAEDLEKMADCTQNGCFPTRNPNN